METRKRTSAGGQGTRKRNTTPTVVKDPTVEERGDSGLPPPTHTGGIFSTSVWRIKNLRAAEYNPRKITASQKAELRKSMNRFGFLQPLVVNIHPERRGRVVGGNQKLAILREDGMSEVSVVEVDLPLREEKELNLRLNKNQGDFNEEVLKEFFNRDDLLQVGFAESEIGFLDEVHNAAAKNLEDRGEPRYPIVPKFDERYDSVMVFCKNEIDFLWLKEILGIVRKKSYKNEAVGECRVIDCEQFRKQLSDYAAKNGGTSAPPKPRNRNRK